MTEHPRTGHSHTLGERVRAGADRWLPYLLVAPALALVVGLVAYPLVWAFVWSLSRVSIFELGSGTFVGLGNYRALMADPRFAHVVTNTATFVLASVVGQVGLGVVLALLLERSWLPRRLVRTLRASFVLPWAVSGVVVAYSWQFVYDARVGLLAELLRLGGVSTAPAWLSSVEWAMVAVIVANVWQGTPFSFVFLTSALAGVPRRLTEAATVGGASRWGTFRHATWPHLRPFLAMNLLLVTVFTVNTFELIYVLTAGGPLDATNVLAVHTYVTAFELGQFGRAAALTVILFGVNAVVVAGYLLVEVNRR